MADDVLDFLRSSFARVNDRLDRIETDLVEIKQRIGFLEGQYANLSNRVDRIADDVLLIKRRLDLVEA